MSSINIKITQLIDGAKKAEGLTVIIDVFRAFTVACYLKDNGAKRIIPIGNIDKAYFLQKNNPDYIIIGERGGEIQKGFDFGNSPFDIANIDFTGKTIVHTTSAGTQGIVGAIHADEVITGSFVNAKAIAKYLKLKNPDMVTLVAMGNAGTHYAQEDVLCAQYIKSLLEENPLDKDEIIHKLRHGDGAKFFDPKMNHIFPQGDFDLCMAFNKFDFILKVEPYKNNLLQLIPYY